ncbi:uncharacterized protein LOC113514379 isoform X2 [Galleria mellonella]|nr:uncharacterized protein LOC113514379 isoform X2 [Galleria mellonella]XP_031763980.1 uncharacterized protein LOC113514379 isoform X2 [Galleria mellonella]XP_031763981.1 uncharacterized protein LOC113514379 isoform X2 [Galleria mellonella]
MLSKFSKNSVYSGTIDYFCLVCEEYLKTENDVTVHIEKQVHTKNLKSTPYFEDKFQESVRKVNAGYYCEFCNQLFTTSAIVKLHITDAIHISKKNFIKRVGNTIVINDDVSIDEKSWNGFIDKTCFVCNLEFDDENIHKTNKKHILNLIQSKVEFRDKGVFRKIENNLFQCLICNNPVDSTHFESSEHEEKYEKCRLKNIPSTSNSIVQETNEEQKKTEIDPKRNENQLDKQANEIKPKVSTNKKKKVHNKNVADNNYHDIDQFVLNKLGAKDYVTDKDSKKWCLLCDWILEPNIVSAHINSQHHLTMLRLHKERIANKSPIQVESDVEDNAVYDKVTTTDPVSDELMDSITEFERHGVKINLEMRTAYCTKCSVHLDFQSEIIKSHIEDHKTKKNKQTEKKNKPEKDNNEQSGTKLYTKPVSMKQKSKLNKREEETPSCESEDLQRFAKNNDLILKNNKYYCSVCSVSLNVSLKSLEEHVSGPAHKNRILRQMKQLDGKLNTTAKLPMEAFMKTVNIVENIFFKDFVINDKYCINILAFYMFTRIGTGLRCQPCEEQFNANDADVHKITDRHACKMQTVPVLTSLDGEFIREVRPNVLHCGYCNLVMDEDNLTDHLNSNAHDESKRSANSRLEKYLPEIRQKRQEETVQMMFMDMLRGSLTF